MSVVKCISLWEPWASLMACGAKTIETRSWGTNYRGPLLICASKRKNLRELAELLSDPAFKLGLAPLLQPGDATVGDLLGRLSFGKAVCLVTLGVCELTEHIDPGMERPFGDYTPGRFAWVTNDLQRIKPFDVTGHQGLWNELTNHSAVGDYLAATGAREGGIS